MLKIIAEFKMRINHLPIPQNIYEDLKPVPDEVQDAKRVSLDSSSYSIRRSPSFMFSLSS